MSITYNVTINPTAAENTFQVTWHDPETNEVTSFAQTADITPQEIQKLWQMSQFQARIGQKLFRFLDGDAHLFCRALQKAHRKGEILQFHLHTCDKTHDWPFELLTQTDTHIFLLPQRLHLIRKVSAKTEGKQENPKPRPLKLLFMACSALDIKPELDFEREEEAIFEITQDLPIHINVEDSGSHAGKTPRPDGTGLVSFTRFLARNYKIPAVLEWGRFVNDEQSFHACKMLFQGSSRGKSILHSIKRARYELLTDFAAAPKPAWPMLRLFSSGMHLNAIVKKNQRWRPKTRILKHVFLRNIQVKVLLVGSCKA